MANEALHSSVREEDEGLIPLLVGDGRSLLVLTALALLFSGGFALFLAVRREFLPHDIQYLGMSAEALCAVGGGRVAAFILCPQSSARFSSPWELYSASRRWPAVSLTRRADGLGGQPAHHG